MKYNKIVVSLGLVMFLLLVVSNAAAQGGAGSPPPPPPPLTVPIDGLSGLLALIGGGYIIKKWREHKQ